jgi:hypothetical protein
MGKNNYKRLKVALIASLILNLAFLSGFVIKKFLSPHPYKETGAGHGKLHCEHGHHKTGYLHLCRKNPGFKKIFDLYKEGYRNASNDLIKVKTEFLNELKKKELNKKALEKILKEVNRMTNELNEKNYRHLLLLKEHLDAEDFAFLLDRMCYVLGTHKEMPCGTVKDHCREK